MKQGTAHCGFTVVELLIVLGLIGILLSFAYIVVPRDVIRVNQETERLARTIDKARFDAVQRNNFVMIGVRPTEFCVLAVSQRSVPFDRALDVAVLPTDPAGLDCAGGTGLEVVAHVPFGVGSNTNISLTLSDDAGGPGVNALTLLVDPRGVGQRLSLSGGALVADGEFWVRVGHTSGYTREINVNRYGRTNLQ